MTIYLLIYLLAKNNNVTALIKKLRGQRPGASWSIGQVQYGLYFLYNYPSAENTRSSANAEGRRDALVSRNPATTKYLT